MRRSIVAVSLIFIFILPSCTVLQQVGEMKMLQKCEFRIGSVTEITLAGVNISRMQNYSQLHIPDAIEIVSAMMSNELPLSFILNLEVKNPNDQRASLNRMEWTVFIDELAVMLKNRQQPNKH